jgi:hypothetical protein
MPTVDESSCPSCGALPGCLTVDLPMLFCSACGLVLGGTYEADRRHVTFPYFDFACIHDTKPHLWPCGCLVNDGDAHRVGCPEYPEGQR